MPQRMTFEEWYSAVDAQLMEAFGVGCDDIPDQPYWEWYQNDEPPEKVVMNFALWFNAVSIED